MEKYLNKSELFPALGRALVTLALVYLIFRGQFKMPGSEVEAIMVTMIVMMIYTLGTLFIPKGQRGLSLAVLLMDCILMLGLIWISGGAHSLMAFAAPLVIIGAAGKEGPMGGVASAVPFGLLMAGLTLYEIPDQWFRTLFWLMYFTTTALASVLIFSSRPTSRQGAESTELEIRNTELEQYVASLEQKLAMFTIVDPITGMKNFRYFRTRVEEEMKRATRQNYPFCVSIMGLDEMEEFTTHYGEQEAHRALNKVAQALERTVRDTDIVAKYVADQFLILLPQSNPRDAIVPSLRIAKRLGNLAFGTDGMFRFHFSFGISGFPEDVKEVGGLFSLASAALERSRQRGVGMITLASSLTRTTP